MVKNRKNLLIAWNNEAWKQYQSLLNNDKRYIKKLNNLIKSIKKNGHRMGIGNPEPLRYVSKLINKRLDRKGLNIPHVEAWSRHITGRDRLVYLVSTSSNRNCFIIISCKYHYKK